MKTLSKTLLISICLAFASVSAQAADKKVQIKPTCNLTKAKSMSEKQIRFCAKNSIGEQKKGWIEILSIKRS